MKFSKPKAYALGFVILSAADARNGRPRKKLGYRTPEELFEAFLGSIYAVPASQEIFIGRVSNLHLQFA